MSAATALTARNTLGVQGVHPVPVEFIRKQMTSVLSDYGADGAKTGMLATPEIVSGVAEQLKKYRVAGLVVDPVMVAKGGGCAFVPWRILRPWRRLPGKSITLVPLMFWSRGGHLKGDAVDLLFDGNNIQTFTSPRLSNRNTHGTGCTFSAALATLLAQGCTVPEAVGKAKEFITRAIAKALDVGAGNGPTNHYAHVLHCIGKGNGEWR